MYLTFGNNTEYHVQAYLSILSSLKQMKANDRIVMVTTVPELYKRVASWIDIVSIDEQQVKEWKGKYQFMFRAKTMILKQMVSHYANDHLLFLDTDTFLYGSLDEIRGLLDNGQALMHKDEGRINQMQGSSLQMWKTVAGKKYAGIEIKEEHHMWNSGVIGIPCQKMQKIFDDALLILDGMLDEGVKSFTVEQYAMSVNMLTHAQVVEGDKYVGHYWGNKQEWQQFACSFLLESYMRNRTIEEDLEQIVDSLWSSVPIFRHRSNTARHLKDLIGKVFPDRNIHYVKKG